MTSVCVKEEECLPGRTGPPCAKDASTKKVNVRRKAVDIVEIKVGLLSGDKEEEDNDHDYVEDDEDRESDGFCWMV